LGSAVATSMNLTNSSEPMGDNGPNGAYKMEGPHDMMYPYQVRPLTDIRCQLLCFHCSGIAAVLFPGKCASS
jgi:hypothetical protein